MKLAIADALYLTSPYSKEVTLQSGTVLSCSGPVISPISRDQVFRSGPRSRNGNAKNGTKQVITDKPEKQKACKISVLQASTIS